MCKQRVQTEQRREFMLVLKNSGAVSSRRRACWERIRDQPPQTGGITRRSAQSALRHSLTKWRKMLMTTDDRNQRPRTRTGGPHSGNSFDYGFTVGIGPQSTEPERGNPPETLSASASTGHAAIIHSIDKGHAIMLDLLVADPTELSAGVDSDACNRTRWRGRIGSSSLRRLQSRDISSNNNILDDRLYRRIAK